MKFLLAGYFGGGNFGDEAILKYTIDVLKKTFKNSQITAISQAPLSTSKKFDVKAVYKFDIKAIMNEIQDCDYLIFPGGSVLQDSTSLKSIIYYLSIIFWAIYHKRHVFLLFQGIGPINNHIARKIAFSLLKKVDLITVRDEKSYKLLQENAIQSTLTADMVWAFTWKNTATADDAVILGDDNDYSARKTLGIQLRKWRSFTVEKMTELAHSIIKNFPACEYRYKLICLQNGQDREVIEEFAELLSNIEQNAVIEKTFENDIEKNIEILQELDYLIAMRFHAGVVAINAQIPLLMLSYDPKVQEFCKDLDLNYIDVNDGLCVDFDGYLNWLLTYNFARTSIKTNIMVKKSQQNIGLFLKMLQ